MIPLSNLLWAVGSDWKQEAIFKLGEWIIIPLVLYGLNQIFVARGDINIKAIDTLTKSSKEHDTQIATMISNGLLTENRLKECERDHENLKRKHERLQREFDQNVRVRSTGQYKDDDDGTDNGR